MRIAFACAIAAFGIAGPVCAQNAENAIDRAVAAHRGMRTARGTFEMIVTTPATGGVYTSRGEFQQRLPNEMALLFSDPKDDRIVSDGKVMWLYLPSSFPGTVRKAPVGSVAGSLDLLGRFLDSPRTRYRITPAGAAVVSGRATTVVHLVPRVPMEEFESAIVWIDDANGLIRQFEVTHAKAQGGQTRRMRFATFQPNGAVDANAFTFVAPKGVKIEDHTKPPGRV